jgi:hypothetical protein
MNEWQQMGIESEVANDLEWVVLFKSRGHSEWQLITAFKCELPRPVAIVVTLIFVSGVGTEGDMSEVPPDAGTGSTCAGPPKT